VSLTRASVSPMQAIAPGRIVIAGGPGSGKSTLLRALAESGERCYEESSRVLIREQLATSGQLLPWADLWAFAQECSARMQAQLRDSTQQRRSFFDRGLPDLVGYLNHGGRSAPDIWRDASRAYAATVFFAPPWREIFVNDSERPQTFAEAQALGAHIRLAYEDYGFHVVELVKSSVADRRRQVLNYLETHPHKFLS
jgi:predicted ATPase